MYLVDNPEIIKVLEESAEIEIPLSEESVIAPDMSGLMDIITEADANWFNIRESMIRLEVDAFLSEDTEMIGEGNRSFFKKVIEALSNMATMLRDFAIKVMNAVANNNKMVQMFLKKHKSSLSRVSDDQLAGMKINVHEFNFERFTRLTKADNIVNQLTEPSDATADPKTYSMDTIKKKVLSQLQINASPGLFHSAIQKEVMGDQPVTKDLKAQDVMKALMFVETGYPSLSAYLKNRNTLVQQNLEAAIAKAKAANTAQDEDKQIYSKKIEFFRNRAKAIQMVTSVTFTLANKRYGESMRILRAAAGPSKPLEGKIVDKKEPESKTSDKVSESASPLDNFL